MIWLAALAHAGSYVVGPQPVEVPVSVDSGVVVQLPGSVRVVTPTTSLQVSSLQAGETTSVRHLEVRARPGAAPERVTFVLADDRSVPVTFVPVPSGADPFADLRFPEPRPVTPDRFLAPERALMQSMLRDEPGRRERVHEELAYAEYPQLDWTLRRRFTAEGLTGFVFELANATDETLWLDATVLRVGRPNRAALVQLDHEVLLPCQARDDAECRTVLRLVVRDDVPTPAIARDVQPFVRVAEETR